MGGFGFRIKPTNLLNIRVGHLDSGLTLCGLVHIVLASCSKPEMRRVHARGFISSGAVVKNALALWNRPDMENPRGDMGVNKSGGFSRRFSHPAVSISLSMRRPNPARFRLVDLCPKTLREVKRQALRLKVFGSNLDLHSRFFRLCHALGCSFTARAFSFYPSPGNSQTVSWLNAGNVVDGWAGVVSGPP